VEAIEDIDKMAWDYTSLFSDEALKKRRIYRCSTSKVDSETPTGSSVGVKPNAVAKLPIKSSYECYTKEQRLRKELSQCKSKLPLMDAISSKTVNFLRYKKQIRKQLNKN
jgi:hypothetical protein